MVRDHPCSAPQPDATLRRRGSGLRRRNVSHRGQPIRRKFVALSPKVSWSQVGPSRPSVVLGSCFDGLLVAPGELWTAFGT
jgi:hypothetical protein